MRRGSNGWTVIDAERFDPSSFGCSIHTPASLMAARSSAPDTIDGVIFHNELCGTPSRPCPKSANAIEIDGRLVPPPCLYVMPDRVEDAGEWNWGGHREVLFPRMLFAMFDIPTGQSSSYTGHIGFKRRGTEVRSTVSCHFGSGRSTNYRS